MGRSPRLKLLLDTHVWLWQLLEPDRLSTTAADAIAANLDGLHLSPVSTWEMLLLARKGRVLLEPTAVEFVKDALRESPAIAAPLTHEIALRSGQLQGFSSEDPADRFLVATALEHDLVLVTRDERMRSFEPLKTLW